VEATYDTCPGSNVTSALWLVLALPEWFFSAFLHPVSGGPLTIVPAVGTASLCLGLVLGLISRERSLLLFLLPWAASETFVAIAGVARGRLTSTGVGPILIGFLIAQLLLSAYLLYRTRTRPWAAAALGLFSLTYAVFAAFVAGMALTDDWL
jgi:hypothetical protein